MEAKAPAFAHGAHAGKGWSLRLRFLCNHKHNVPEAQVKIPIQEAGFAEILRLFGLIAGAPIWHFKTNEAGTTTTLAEDSAHNRIAGKLRDAFFRELRYEPSPAEVSSWAQLAARIESSLRIG